MLGLSDEIIDVGAKVGKININNGGRKKSEVLVGDAGIGQSQFPFILSVTQDEHEEILQRRLDEAGTHVERGVELVKMDLPPENDVEGYVNVTIRPVGTENDETVTASYVIGCDGAHSGVRHATGIAMEGGTYSRTFFVADVFCHGPMQMDGNLNLCTSHKDFIIILPLPHKSNRARIIGLVPEDLQHLDEEITFQDCLPAISKAAPGLEVEDVRWFAHYKVHHRCASSFQYGRRVFMCGDSAHLHSPVGGQGMNTGLGDASNLAWKVATAWHAAAKSPGSKPPEFAEALLSTYNAERKRFADRLVQSNDRLFQFIIQRNAFGWILRNIFAPYILPFILNWFNLRPFLFGMVSQIAIEYGPSPLSQSNNNNNNNNKGLQGCRLPWIERPSGAAGKDDNHSLLDGTGWQGHVFGDVDASQQRRLQGLDIPVHQFPWSSEARRRGFRENALYLIRPDGYIGLVLDRSSASEGVLKEYVRRWGVGQLK
jgi:2-polyprenyl-6-methoxyphenol hydroxylase-like FAD-dependent oxidoreductase